MVSIAVTMLGLFGISMPTSLPEIPLSSGGYALCIQHAESDGHLATLLNQTNDSWGNLPQQSGGDFQDLRRYFDYPGPRTTCSESQTEARAARWPIGFSKMGVHL